jgi:hypothetical protein
MKFDIDLAAAARWEIFAKLLCLASKVVLVLGTRRFLACPEIPGGGIEGRIRPGSCCAACHNSTLGKQLIRTLAAQH